MSDRPMGTGWYQASDGLWYPPAGAAADERPPSGGALRGTLGEARGRAGQPASPAPAAPPSPPASPPPSSPAPPIATPPGHDGAAQVPDGRGSTGHALDGYAAAGQVAPRSASMFAGPVDDPDRFRLLSLQSRGGEGELWRGEIVIDRVAIPVAVKVIHPSNAVNLSEWRTRWQRQAELLRSLDHSGLVKVRDVFEGPVPHPAGIVDPSSRSLFLIMNWVDGYTLEQWVASYPQRTFVDSLRLVERLASAVDHLHTGGLGGWPIVHRDIKPANVIVNGSKACLVDFGFARILSDQPMTLVGTPSYLAPEVLSQGMYSEASDRFALGGTAYFALTGQRPVPADLPSMSAVLRSVPGIEGRDDVAAAFLVMLHPDPYQRPRNATQWVRSVASTAGGGRASLGTAAPPLSSTPMPSAPMSSPGGGGYAAAVPPARAPARPAHMTGQHGTGQHRNTAHAVGPHTVAPRIVGPPAKPQLDKGQRRSRSLNIALVCIVVAILALVGVLLGIVLSRSAKPSSSSVPPGRAASTAIAGYDP